MRVLNASSSINATIPVHRDELFGAAAAFQMVLPVVPCEAPNGGVQSGWPPSEKFWHLYNASRPLEQFSSMHTSVATLTAVASPALLGRGFFFPG